MRNDWSSFLKQDRETLNMELKLAKSFGFSLKELKKIEVEEVISRISSDISFELKIQIAKNLCCLHANIVYNSIISEALKLNFKVKGIDDKISTLIQAQSNASIDSMREKEMAINLIKARQNSRSVIFIGGGEHYREISENLKNLDPKSIEESLCFYLHGLNTLIINTHERLMKEGEYNTKNDINHLKLISIDMAEDKAELGKKLVKRIITDRIKPNKFKCINQQVCTYLNIITEEKFKAYLLDNEDFIVEALIEKSKVKNLKNLQGFLESLGIEYYTKLLCDGKNYLSVPKINEKSI